MTIANDLFYFEITGLFLLNSWFSWITTSGNFDTLKPLPVDQQRPTSVNEILGKSLSSVTEYSLATTSSVSQFTRHKPPGVSADTVPQLDQWTSAQGLRTGHLTFEKWKHSSLVTEALCISGDIDRGPYRRCGTKWCWVLTVAALCSCQMHPHV